MKSAVLSLSLFRYLRPCPSFPSPLIVPRQSFVLCASRNSGTISVALNKELMNTKLWMVASLYIPRRVSRAYRARARARALSSRSISLPAY